MEPELQELIRIRNERRAVVDKHLEERLQPADGRPIVYPNWTLEQCEQYLADSRALDDAEDAVADWLMRRYRPQA